MIRTREKRFFALLRMTGMEAWRERILRCAQNDKGADFQEQQKFMREERKD